MSDFSLDKYTISSEKDIENILIPLSPGDRIFFIGELGSGKSTYIRALLRSHFGDPELIVRSPTYTYYQKYGTTLYHFDLYRVEAPENIELIGARDILDDPGSICLIEWPQILSDTVQPTHTISIYHLGDTHREITIMHHRVRATE